MIVGLAYVDSVKVSATAAGWHGWIELAQTTLLYANARTSPSGWECRRGRRQSHSSVDEARIDGFELNRMVKPPRERPAGAREITLSLTGPVSLACRRLQRVHVVAEMRHLAVAVGDKPNIANVQRGIAWQAPVMARGLDNEFAAHFAYTDIMERSETNAGWELPHMGRNGVTSYQATDCPCGGQWELMDGVGCIDFHPSVKVTSLSGVKRIREPRGHD